jgi:hypothetical protein
MLDIRPAVDDGSAAPVAAPAPAKPDRAALDRRDIQRKCLRHWDTVFNMIVDLRGKSMLMQLGPNFRPNPDGHVRYGEPRLVSFSGPDHREETLGAWYNRGGDGASGSNLFDLVMYLGQCDLKTATAFLKDLADRLCEIKS